MHEGYRKARQEVERALELDPELAEGYAVLGRIQKSYDWDREGATAAIERALALEPGNPRVLRFAAAHAGTLGRGEEAVDLDRRAVQLDPLSSAAYFGLGFDCWYLGRLDEGEAALRKVLDLNPGYPGAHRLLGVIHLMRSNPEAALEEVEREPDPTWRRHGLSLVYHALGRKREADAILGEILEKDKDAMTYQIAEVYAFRGEADEAFAWLDRAYALRDGGLNEIKGDPLLRNIEADPRYSAFLKKFGLPS